MDYLKIQLLFYLGRQGDQGKLSGRAVLYTPVILIALTLGWLAIPSFLNQPCKVKQSEARYYVGYLNKAQEGYIIEQKRFGSNIKVLGVGINTDTKNFTYATTSSPYDGKNMTNNYAVSVAIAAPREDRNINNFWKSEARAARNYIGRVNLAYVPQTSEITSIAIRCEAKEVNVPLTVEDTKFTQLPGQEATLECVGGAEAVGN